MILLTKIKEQVALITLLAVWTVIVLNTFTRVPPSGLTTPARIVTYVLTVVSLSVLFSVIPAIAVTYGWYTGKKIRAVLMGAIPLPALMILGFIVTSGHTMVFVHVTGTILFVIVLSVLSGLAGYCAAQRTKPCLAVAIILVGVWSFLLMHALN